MNGRRAASIFLLLVVQVTSMAQSGYMPLSRLIEAPTAAAMHRYKSATHTSIRPYLVRDTIGYGSMDSVARFSALPLLDKWAAPTGKWHGGPLLDASFGAALGDRNATTYRAGAGAWLNFDPTSDWSAHADVQYWSETLPDYLDTLFDATHTSLGEGYARGNGPYDHYDWNAYVNYHPGKYFDLTLGRGKQFFGEGYRSLFLSDNATSYPYFRITTTVWHIRYVNLFTQLSDTRGSKGDPSAFKKKYASFHYLSWNASKRFNFAVFEGVVWQSGDSLYPRGFDINYLNPVVLYRPVEYAQGSADNALLGFAINVKVGNRTTLYFQGMLDEFL